MDESLKPDPDLKGGYYRRIADIERALMALGTPRLPPEVQFLAYFFGCEKLAHGIVGIHMRWPARQAYSVSKKLDVSEIQMAVNALELGVTDEDIHSLFGKTDTSARTLRNNLAHNFGPTNALKITQHAPSHIPSMRRFLDCAPKVHAYQVTHFKK